MTTLSLVIPTRSVPAQSLNCTLANQACRINLQQRPTGLFADLYLSDTLLVASFLCRAGIGFVPDAYQGFVGNIAFFDMHPTQAGTTPDGDPARVMYGDLNARYFLGYYV